MHFVQHTRTEAEETLGLFRECWRADQVNQVHSFTCSCPKEVVDGVTQYLPCYSPFYSDFSCVLPGLAVRLHVLVVCYHVNPISQEYILGHYLHLFGN